jgi:threonine-phosphate decarboxylase
MESVKQGYLDEISPPRHGGRVEEVAEERGIDPEELIDFSANMNPLAPPDSLEGLVKEAIDGLPLYPDDRYENFRKSVVNFLEARGEADLKTDLVVPGNGSVEIFRLFLQLVAYAGAEKGLIPYPTFSEYGLQSRLHGLEVERVKLEELLDYDRQELESYDVVFLCNPNNPTGTLRSKDQIIQFVSRCEAAGTYALLDEAFIELSRPEESLIGKVKEFSNLVVARSLTKEFTIPGLRIGYGVFPPGMAGRAEKLRPPWNLNHFAAYVGSRFLAEENELITESRDYLAGEREWLSGKLEELGFTLYRSETNYLLFRTEGVGYDASELVEGCLEDGILLRNADSFYGLDRWHVRVAVKKRKENRKLLSALRRAIDS